MTTGRDVKLRRWKAVAVVGATAALLALGAAQTARLSTPGPGGGEAACLPPMKVFHFALNENGMDRERVSALLVRVAPEVPVGQLRFEPSPEEILPTRDGALELRYPRTALARASSLQITVCAASPAHEVREAYWIVRERGQTLARLVSAESLTWEWREDGVQAVPGTRRIVREIACAGEALVRPYQFVAPGEPVCVKDPEALARLQAELERLQAEMASPLGRLKALILGDRVYQERLAALNARMAALYLYAPSEGLVLGVARDERNGLVWVRLQAEAAPSPTPGADAEVRVAP